MLRLQSKIVITPKDKGGIDPNSPTAGNQLITVLSQPLQASRQRIEIDAVHSVEINSSFKELTSTATVTIPNNATFQGKKIASGINAIIKRGDQIVISLGYFGGDFPLREVFRGYVSSVSIGTPIQINCEDSMFVLKRKKIVWPQVLGTHHNKTKTGKDTKKSYANITKIKLKELVDDVLLDGTGIKSRILTDVDINVTQFNSSVAEVFDKLKKTYGLYSYFVTNEDGEPVIHVGLAADASRTNEVEFVYEEQIIDDSDLKYQREEDVLLRVEAESIDSKTNKREKVEVGDDDGQHKKFFIMNATKAELTRFAQSKLYEEKYEGMRGSFETFGEPYVQHGDRCKLTSLKFPEKNGVYQITGVNRKFGVDTGYRQIITIGQRLTF